MIASDDDLFVLNLAKEKNGIVVSLDQFRDAYERTADPGIIDVIENRFNNRIQTRTEKKGVAQGFTVCSFRPA